MASGSGGPRAAVPAGRWLRFRPAQSAGARSDLRAHPPASGNALMRLRSALLVPAVLLCLVIGLVAGTVPLSLAQVWSGLWHSDAGSAVIVRELRAPRVLLAFPVGGSLSGCGAALQAMIRHPRA